MMNHVALIGRIVKDPEVKGDTSKHAKYTLAVDRPTSNKENNTDFISCVAFGSNADFAGKYLKKGMKIAVEGRLQTGSYEKDGKRVYTTDVIVNRHEFCESKNAVQEETKDTSSVLEIPEGIEEALPFK